MIKKGINVKVLTGKDKKKDGEVMEIDRKNNRAKVKGINIVKKHVKTTKEKKGGIISKENFIHLSNITGQKPVVTKFKKSVSNFKTRKNTNAGLKVTLRKNKMYEFIDRLVNIALPRIKDFRGLNSKGFDKFGNYTFGIKEHIVFPEVNFDKVDKIRGLDITIVIKSQKKEHSFELLKKLNFPFFGKRDN